MQCKKRLEVKDQFGTDKQIRELPSDKYLIVPNLILLLFLCLFSSILILVSSPSSKDSACKVLEKEEY